MELRLMCLKDTAVQAFMVPQAVVHRNALIRALTEGLKNSENKSDWVKHPDDFELYEVGTFNDQTGVVTAYASPELVVRLKDLVRV